jgi:1-acyl-sn-glycerol-3-phosphate acyltransferase
MVLVLRSLLFNLAFYVNLAGFMIGGFWFFFTPRKWSIRALQCWARVSLWLLKTICAITVEVRHRERIAPGPALIAVKHQSLFETFALLPLFDDPAVVLKRELTLIPLFGWFALKFKMIPVDRSAHVTALRDLVQRAQQARDMGRQIVMFPEGTRRASAAPADYKPGIAALYRRLDLPCLPMALNSGLFWPRRKFLRYPGAIVIECLEPIPAGLARREFMAELQGRIEPATRRLEAEAERQSC